MFLVSETAKTPHPSPCGRHLPLKGKAEGRCGNKISWPEEYPRENKMKLAKIFVLLAAGAAALSATAFAAPYE